MGKTTIIGGGTGGGGGAVDSWNGRTGNVVPENGDYNTGQVTEVTDKNYVTNAEKAAIGTGEANTTSNQGGGFEVALPKSGVDLPLRTFAAGQNININQSADQLEISSNITTAGLLARVFFTADATVLPSGTYYQTAIGSRGTTPSAQQDIVVNDNQKLFFGQDIISSPRPTAEVVQLGAYVSELTLQTSSNQADQRFTIEVYDSDGDGNPIDSGLAGQPVGDLGVRPVGILDSGQIDMIASNPTKISLFAFITEEYTFAQGNRARYHISGEKVGIAGGNITLSLFTGSDWNSYIDIPTIGAEAKTTFSSRYTLNSPVLIGEILDREPFEGTSTPMGVPVPSGTVLKGISFIAYTASATAAGTLTFRVTKFPENSPVPYTTAGATQIETLEVTATGAQGALFYEKVEKLGLDVTIPEDNQMIFVDISTIGFWNIDKLDVYLLLEFPN